MTEKPRVRPGGAAIDLVFDETGRCKEEVVRFHWTSKPIYRAGEKFKAMRAWLDQNKRSDWGFIDSIAYRYHPAYPAESSTEEAGQAGLCAAVFQDMERHDYKPEMIRALAPELLGLLPKKPRGTPGEFFYLVLLVSACLACHEYCRLCWELEETGPAEIKIAQHLYWFERFAALWRFTAASKPPQWDVVAGRRSKAVGWQTALTDHVRAYRERHPGSKLRQAVSSFYSGGVDSPQFLTGYRWALRNLRQRVCPNFCV